MERLEHRVFKSFNEIFEGKLDNSITREASFERASEEFYNRCGFHAYKDTSSFNTARYKRRKNRGKK